MLRLSLILICLAGLAWAAPQQYQLDKTRSEVAFSYIFEGAEKTGVMPIEAADIRLDLDNLAGSSVTVLLNARRARAGFVFATEAMKSPRGAGHREAPDDPVSVHRVCGRSERCGRAGPAERARHDTACDAAGRALSPARHRTRQPQQDDRAADRPDQPAGFWRKRVSRPCRTRDWPAHSGPDHTLVLRKRHGHVGVAVARARSTGMMGPSCARSYPLAPCFWR